MADELEQAREVAKKDVDKFIEETIPQLKAFIQQENDVRKLQRALKSMERINATITNRKNFGEMNQEGEENLNNLKAATLERIQIFKDRIPDLRNYIKTEGNIQNLEQAVRRLDDMDRSTNPADVLGV